MEKKTRIVLLGQGDRYVRFFYYTATNGTEDRRSLLQAQAAARAVTRAEGSAKLWHVTAAKHKELMPKPEPVRWQDQKRQADAEMFAQCVERTRAMAAA